MQNTPTELNTLMHTLRLSRRCIRRSGGQVGHKICSFYIRVLLHYPQPRPLPRRPQCTAFALTLEGALEGGDGTHFFFEVDADVCFIDDGL